MIPAGSAARTTGPPPAIAGVGNIWGSQADGRGLRVALCASRFHERLVARLAAGAVAALGAAGIEAEDMDLAWAPGAFELPLLARTLAASGRYDAVVALGVVIRGETPHFEYVAGECARGLADAASATGVPVLLGVITADTVEQAEARAGGASNKGEEAARAAVEMACVLAEAR